MLNRIEAWYRLLLQAYPAQFRETFGAEAQGVFGQALRAAAARGRWAVVEVCWRELRDWPAAAARAHWHAGRQGMSDSWQLPTVDQPLPWGQALAGTLPYVLFGLASYLSKVVGPTIVSPFLYFFLAVLLGVIVGYARGFPRWSLTYVVWSAVFTWWWTSMGTGWLGERLGLSGREVWGWLAWVPLAAALLAGLVLARSLRPLRALGAGLWRELTWLSLGAYTLPAWLTLIFDENHHPALPLLMALASLAAAGGVALYLHGARPLQRGLGLVGGAAGLALVDVYAWSTWDFYAYYGLPAQAEGSIGLVQPAVLFAVWAVLLMGPAVAGEWTRPATA